MPEIPGIFIDGEAGTTGLDIAERLSRLSSVRLLRIDPARRKDADARRALMRAADLVVLCLPDAAAMESVAIAASLGEAAPRILDASTAHRIHPDWVYGFAEMAAAQPHRIATAARVANPGCYATGAIALLRPLVEAGLIPADQKLSINAVSGYSGGGHSMIAEHEAKGGPAFALYALGLEHKHLPEIIAHAGLTSRPLFVPSVGHFRQGMLVSIPLHTDLLPGRPGGADLQAALAASYPQTGLVRVVAADGAAMLEPEALNGTDRLELFVYANDARRQALLVARLDNLGKGASGAAVQNIGLMLGLAEA